MKQTSLKFKEYRCFKDDWAGFDRIAPLNIIIGRNNCGKSALLDLLDELPKYTKSRKEIPPFRYYFNDSCVLTEPELRRAFPENTSQGVLGGNHWRHHGARFVNAIVKWTIDSRDGLTELTLDKDLNSHFGYDSTDARKKTIVSLLSQRPIPLGLGSRAMRRVVADRDIVPEPGGNELSLSKNGQGATNIIRRFLNSSSPKYPRRYIQNDLLRALNEVFASDANFLEIEVQEHDETDDAARQGCWEIHLLEKEKGLVPLSKSGSGLKTTILVLLNLLVIPVIEEKKPADYVFAFEELENNLHPSLLRRLLGFIEEFALKNGTHVFLTTHSSVALDMFFGREHVQITHVEHDGRCASSRSVNADLDGYNILDDLGARPSDLLQANGILWVEGPSDRIYLNRWIEIYSDGQLREGRHYQCAFFGGSLLANYCYGTKDSEEDAADILQINKNAILIADGDRTAPSGKGSRIKQRVSALKAPIEELDHGYVWITEAKEIESYIPAETLGAVWKVSDLPRIGQYDFFYREPTKQDNSKGYYQKHCRRKSFDKVQLARQVVPLMTRRNLAPLFDLDREMCKICDRIQKWNDL